MKDYSSPEDKLLKLIRNPKKSSESPGDRVSLLKARAVSGINKDADLGPKSQINKYGVFLKIRKACFWLFIASCIFLISTLVYPWVGLKNIRLPKPSGKPAEELFTVKHPIKPIEKYLEDVRDRQIFSANAVTQSASSINVANIDLMKDIILVGIISGDNPQAVIEDKKAQKTYYVNKGQFIGEMQVEDIQERKIIINYAGQKYELYM